MRERINFVFGALLVATFLHGCSTAQTMWYRCDHPGWSGWDYQKECLRLTGAAR